MMKRFMSGQGPLSLIMVRPAAGYLSTYSLLHSPLALRRLEGYYALKDYGIPDIAFLKERFNQEDNEAARRVLLLLIMENTGRMDRIEWIEKNYPDLSDTLKADLLQYLFSYDQENYKLFIKKYRPPSWYRKPETKENFYYQ